MMEEEGTKWGKSKERKDLERREEEESRQSQGIFLNLSQIITLNHHPVFL